jgi:hypothetical protein
MKGAQFLKNLAFTSLLLTGLTASLFGQSVESKTIRLRSGEIPTINCAFLTVS